MNDDRYDPEASETVAGHLVGLAAGSASVVTIYQFSDGLPNPGYKIAAITAFFLTFWIIWKIRSIIIPLFVMIIKIATVLSILGILYFWIFS
jgi:hypothetical protein